jgi:hypothetical protein
VAIKYSPTEAARLKLLPVNGDRITVKALADKYYKQQTRPMPFHGQVFIANAMRALAVKSTRNREKYRVKRTPKAGPNEVHYWRENK